VDSPGRSRSAYNNLVIARHNEGKKDEAKQVLDDWFARYPLEYGMVRHRFMIRWGMGDIAGAQAAACDGLDTLSDDVFAQIDLRRRLKDLKLAQGKLADARALTLERRGVTEARGLALQTFWPSQGGTRRRHACGGIARTPRPRKSISAARPMKRMSFARCPLFDQSLPDDFDH
jgi:hypothetical protein